MEIIAITAGLQALPIAVVVLMATALVLLAAVLARILTNTFHGKAPPVDEGIPFIGGLIKFSKVGHYLHHFDLFQENQSVLLLLSLYTLQPLDCQ